MGQPEGVYVRSHVDDDVSRHARRCQQKYLGTAHKMPNGPVEWSRGSGDRLEESENLRHEDGWNRTPPRERWR